MNIPLIMQWTHRTFRAMAFVLVMLVLIGVPVLAVIAMDCLTYGDPPGLFKNETWQAIRTLWADDRT